MLDLTGYGFQVVARAPAAESNTGLKALADKLKTVGATVTMLNSTDDADPVMKFVTQTSETFRVFLMGRRDAAIPHRYILQHRCADHYKDAICSCIYSMAEDTMTNEDADLTNITKAAMDVARLPSKIKLCGHDATKVQSRDLSRNYEVFYQISADTPITMVATNAGRKYVAGFYSGHRTDGKSYTSRSIDAGDSVHDYVTSSKISQDLASAVPNRISAIERDIGKPLKELDFLRGLKA